MRVLIIDNYDSFTYNLYQYVGEIFSALCATNIDEIIVKRNNEISLEQAKELAPNRIIISPGPGNPDNESYFGICSKVITEMGKTTPLLGVCLGMQGIAHCFGGEIIRAPVPMHGKTSVIQHDGQGVYRNMPQGLEIMRYHSLMIQADSLPDSLTVTSVVAENEQFANSSSTDDFLEACKSGREIMGVRHKEYPIEGIQYHPESFATDGGKELLKNFLHNPAY